MQFPKKSSGACFGVRSEYIWFLQSLLSPIFLKYNSQGWNIGDKGDRSAFPESICPLHYIVRLARY
ncbi:hypothetical protein, partial [Paenibacillus lactis]|uniref:hypothetical protein n=1 Tax=Paenibacillus lactis TaxID=228574 RepID=UPI001BCCB70A